jgi:hypothetical protein
MGEHQDQLGSQGLLSLTGEAAGASNWRTCDLAPDCARSSRFRVQDEALAGRLWIAAIALCSNSEVTSNVWQERHQASVVSFAHEMVKVVIGQIKVEVIRSCGGWRKPASRSWPPWRELVAHLPLPSPAARSCPAIMRRRHFTPVR